MIRETRERREKKTALFIDLIQLIPFNQDVFPWEKRAGIDFAVN